MAQSLKVKAKTKVRIAKLNKELRPMKMVGKIKNKSPTKLSKTITSKKTVHVLLVPTLFALKGR